MRLLVAAITLSVLLPQSALAGQLDFPYEAIVEVDDVAVHSGPGTRYYATSRLKAGDRVMVIRHDPGGWYMITPPAGSFSWIPAEVVERQGETRGVVTANNVSIRVGSALEASSDVEQVRLSRGDEVEILEEINVDGSTRLYRIEPPRHEWRWLTGRSITAMSALRQETSTTFESPQQVDNTPTLLAVPQENSSENETLVIENEEANAEITTAAESQQNTQEIVQIASEGPSLEITNETASILAATEVDDIEAKQAVLKQIDDRFQEMVEQEASEWDLESLERDYRTLQEASAGSQLAGRIVSRLDALARYRAVKADYDEFMQITSETSRKDAELAALQQQQERASVIPRRPRRRISNRPQPMNPYQANRRGFPVPHRPPHPSARMQGPMMMPPNGMPTTGGSRPPYAQQQPMYRYPPNMQTQQYAPRGPMPPQYAPGSPMPQQYAPGRSPRSYPWAGAPGQRPIRERGGWFRNLFRTFDRGRPEYPRRYSPTQQSLPEYGQQDSLQQFEEFGIVQQAVTENPGAPRHVLLAPNGRILAYLNPRQGVQLDRYVGQSMGVYGARQPGGELQNDIIQVEALEPTGPEF